MKVVVACGGTGGHSFPGLAVASELKRRGDDVTVWMSGRAVESSVLKGWDGPVFSTGARQLHPRYALSILLSVYRCWREMRRARPDALLAMGSYSSLPPVLAARICGVRVVLHEANTVPGRAVEFLAHFAYKVAVSFASTISLFPPGQAELTGLPVRAEIAGGTRLVEVPSDAFVIFVTGGSQGAHAVNLLATDAIVKLKRALETRPDARPLYVIHQTGVKDESFVRAAYRAAGVEARVNAFEYEMANAFATADIVIARAGASTCFELAACGKPAFFIPLPTAMRDHQRFNAEAFVAKGAADSGNQSMLSAKTLKEYLLARVDNPASLAEMSLKMRSLATPDAAARVADLVRLAVAV